VNDQQQQHQQQQQRSLYDILGLDKLTATEKDIRRAYRRIAKKEHPDKNNGKSSQLFVDATNAYNVLMDPAKKKIYDETGTYDSGPSSAVEEQMYMELAQLFLQAIESGACRDRDIFEAMRESIDNKRSVHKMEIQKYKRKQGDLESFVDRIKDNKNEFFTKVLNSQIAKILSAIKEIEEEIARGGKLLDFLMEFKDNITDIVSRARRSMAGFFPVNNLLLGELPKVTFKINRNNGGQTNNGPSW